MTVTWSDAGNPKAQLTLDDVRRWAEEYGYVKTSVPKDRPAAQRVDLVAFFNVYSTNAFSLFKKKFRTRRLKPPNEPQVRTTLCALAPRRVSDTERRRHFAAGRLLGRRGRRGGVHRRRHC